MSKISPYKITSGLEKQSALMSFTHEQLVVLANTIWNHYAVKDDPSLAPLAVEYAEKNESIVQTVHDASVNCILALVAMNKG